MFASSLLARDLVKLYGDRRVLDGVGLTAHPGQRIGLVGENGVGKSTLLRLLAGVEEPDHGEVQRPVDVGFLAQELPFEAAQTVGDVIAEALAVPRGLLRRLDELSPQVTDASLLAEYGEVLTRAEEIDAWGADRRADEILHGLGLAAIGRDRPLGTLSGGQRSRVGLAALLVRRPGALLLDEPTNHLDDDAIGFVERHLRSLPGVVVVVSHDRVFLDAVCTDIVDLDPARGGVTRYGGAYTAYLQAKAAARARWEQAFAEQQDQINALRLAIVTTARQVAHGRPPRDGNKMGYNAHGEFVQAAVSQRVRNAQQKLTVLERDAIRKPPAPLRFRATTLTAEVPVDGDAITARALLVPGRLSLDRVDVPAGGRLLVTGPNGSGKSTLLAVLAGQLAPAEGVVLRQRGLKIGLLAQDDHFPDPTATPRGLYDRVGAEVSLVELGLVAPRDLDRQVGQLSVGQRRRVALALLIAAPPHVLLLDEPTNHLSLALADELEQALGAAPGAVVIASHDRWLRRGWDGATLALPRPA